MFLYIDPIKQGLKLVFNRFIFSHIGVFIHRSNKTRIETAFLSASMVSMPVFLYIDPIKQGLKQNKIIQNGIIY